MVTKRRALTMLLGWLVFACGTSIASADETPLARVTITLKDGTTVKGELLDGAPGNTVTMRAENGDVRVFAQAEVVKTEPLRKLKAARLTPAIPYGVKSYDGPDAVQVHMEAISGAPSLYASADGEHWDGVCSAPCDIPLDPKVHYRVGGPTLADSSEFRLSLAKTQTLHVDPSQEVTGVLGWINLVIGLGMTIPAAYLLSRPASDGPGADENHLPGYILMADGAPFVIAGIVLLANSGTSVSVEPGSSALALSRAPSVELGNGVRLGLDGVSF